MCFLPIRSRGGAKEFRFELDDSLPLAGCIIHIRTTYVVNDLPFHSIVSCDLLVFNCIRVASHSYRTGKSIASYMSLKRGPHKSHSD